MKIQKKRVNTSSNYFPLRARGDASSAAGFFISRGNDVLETPGNDLPERELLLIPQSDWHRERLPLFDVGREAG